MCLQPQGWARNQQGKTLVLALVHSAMASPKAWNHGLCGSCGNPISIFLFRHTLNGRITENISKGPFFLPKREIESWGLVATSFCSEKKLMRNFFWCGFLQNFHTNLFLWILKPLKSPKITISWECWSVDAGGCIGGIVCLPWCCLKPLLNTSPHLIYISKTTNPTGRGTALCPWRTGSQGTVWKEKTFF